MKPKCLLALGVLLVGLSARLTRRSAETRAASDRTAEAQGARRRTGVAN